MICIHTCNMTRKRIELKPGEPIGDYLTVIGPDGRMHRSIAWKCQCKCGNTVTTRSSCLITGAVKSCGCHKIGKNNKGYLGYEDISGTYWSSIVHGASKRGLEVAVTIEDCWRQYQLQEGKCAISGVSIEFAVKAGNLTEQTASLDRIDSSKGYTTDNIQWIHKDVNKLKTNFDQQSFVRWCKIISEHWGD